MRVSFDTPYSPREITGVGEIVANLGKGLNERGHEYVILTKTSTEASREIEGLKEIRYRQMRFAGGFLLTLCFVVF